MALILRIFVNGFAVLAGSMLLNQSALAICPKKIEGIDRESIQYDRQASQIEEKIKYYLSMHQKRKKEENGTGKFVTVIDRFQGDILNILDPYQRDTACSRGFYQEFFGEGNPDFALPNTPQNLENFYRKILPTLIPQTRKAAQDIYKLDRNKLVAAIKCLGQSQQYPIEYKLVKFINGLSYNSIYFKKDQFSSCSVEGIEYGIVENGRYIFNITLDDYNLYIEEDRLGGHINITRNLVLSGAGVVEFKGGKILMFSNDSGHYQPSSVEIINSVVSFLRKNGTEMLSDDFTIKDYGGQVLKTKAEVLALVHSIK